MDAVAAEIDVVERKGSVVDEPPNEVILTPLMLLIKEAPVDIVELEIVPMNAVPLEIDVVERKGSVVAPPNELTSMPLMLETKSIAVDKLLVETEADVVIPELLRVVVVVVPVTDRDPAPNAPDTVKAPMTADVAAKVPVTVLFSVNNDPPEILPEITAVAPFTAPVAFRTLTPTFPENEPVVPETAPSEVKEPT